MKCKLMCRGPSLWGPVVNIKDQTSTHTTHQYLRTYWDSSIWSLEGEQQANISWLPVRPTLTSVTICISPFSRLAYSSSYCSFGINILAPFMFKFGFCAFSPHCGSSFINDEHLSFPHFPLSFALPAGCQHKQEIEMRLTLRQLVLLWL